MFFGDYFKKQKRRVTRFTSKNLIKFFLELEEISCPLCQSKNSIKLQYEKDRYGFRANLVRCECGLVFQNPMPTEKFISFFYKTPLFRALDWGVLFASKNIMQEFGAVDRAQKHINFFSQLSKNLIDLTKDNKESSILDVGASDGTFLKIINKSFPNINLFAIEPGANFLKMVKEEDLKVRTWQSLDDISNNQFDYITMWHVLEHIRGPVEFLSKVNFFLKEEGFLIFEVPDFSKYGNDLRPIHLDHLVHFDQAALIKVLEKAGFETVLFNSDKLCLMDDIYGVKVLAKKLSSKK